MQFRSSQILVSSSRLSTVLTPKLVFILLFVIYSTKSLYRRYPLAGDEPNYVFDAYIFWRYRTRETYDFYFLPEIVSNVYPGGVLSPHVVGESLVSYHSFGLSFILSFFTSFGDPTINVRLFMCSIVAITFALIYKLSLQWKFSNKFIASTGVLSIALGAPIMFNVDAAYPEFLGSLCFILLLVLVSNLLYHPDKIRKSIFLIGLLFYIIPWIHIRFIPILLIFFVIILFETYTIKRGSIKKEIMIFIVPSLSFLLSIITMSFFYKKWYDTYDIFFIRALQPGGFLDGNLSAVYRTAGAYMFNGAEGLLPWQPTLFFALIGISLILNLQKRYFYYFIIFLSGYFFTISQAGALGGDTPTLHYMSFIIPFLTVPLILILDVMYKKIKNIFYYFYDPESTIKRTVSISSLWSTGLLVFFLISTSFWSSILSVSGSIYKGDTYIRSATQGDPLLPTARLLRNLWPDFTGPTTGQDFSLVNLKFSWTKAESKSWEYIFSQGYRPKDTFVTSISVRNPSPLPSKLSIVTSFYDRDLLSQNRHKVVVACSKESIVPPFITQEIEIACPNYEVREIIQKLHTNNPQIQLVKFDFRPIKPSQNSNFPDLGFFILMSLFIVITSKKIYSESKTIN